MPDIYNLSKAVATLPLCKLRQIYQMTCGNRSRNSTDPHSVHKSSLILHVTDKKGVDIIHQCLTPHYAELVR